MAATRSKNVDSKKKLPTLEEAHSMTKQILGIALFMYLMVIGCYSGLLFVIDPPKVRLYIIISLFLVSQAFCNIYFSKMDRKSIIDLKEENKMAEDIAGKRGLFLLSLPFFLIWLAMCLTYLFKCIAK